MKKIFKFLIVITLIGVGFYVYMAQNGHNLDSILNTPKKIELRVKSSKVENFIVTSSTNITVNNLFKRRHNNVTVRVTAYDKNNYIVKQKNVTFEETLKPNGSLIKLVFLPAKARRCETIVIDSNPY
jgi:hypothetical protein